MKYRYTQEIDRAFQRGVVKPKDSEDKTVLGYHGTSIEAILLSAQTGVLPAGTVEESGIFYIPSRFKRTAYDAATNYADTNAKTMLLLDRLGISKEQLSLAWQVTNFFYETYHDDESTHPEYNYYLHEAQQRFQRTKEEIEQSLTDIFKEDKRKGCIITITNEAQPFSHVLPPFKSKGLQPSINDLDDEIKDYRIHGERSYLAFPNGMPLKYIAGIEALSNEEYTLLESLQQNN